MKLLCGLGNPGREYALHRHNIGFRILEKLASMAAVGPAQSKFEGRVRQGTLGSERVLLLEPETFMNGSGRSLAAAARFYKLSPAETLVIHDELDLPFGRIQLKSGGGAGGHNGLRSILSDWGEDAFGRLRFGVGRPAGSSALAPKDRVVVAHVLSNFSREESGALDGLIDLAADAASCWAREGMATAMNRHNRRG